MSRRRLVPLLVVLAALLAAVTVSACGGSDEPTGTVVGEITIGTGTQGTNPGGEGGEGETAESPPEEGGAGDTGQTTEAPAGGDADQKPGDPAAGKEVFVNQAQPQCGTCHTLEDAGTNGQVGPVLDDAKPTYERVVEYVTNGRGAMPAYKDSLSEEQIQNVAAYVSEVTGGGEG
jgi:mono/diheme cytochrome c family protein